MKNITVLNTAIATKNVGDEIIVDSAKKELHDIFENKAMFYNIPTHEVISRHSRRIINNSDYSFVTGTNLLSSKLHLIKANQWNIGFYDAYKFKRVVLMGAGWTNYQGRSSLLTKIMYNNALDPSIIHSVRDSYTKRKLEEIGISNVVNTACPTMWRLTPEHCNSIPREKAEYVVTTITDYRKNYKRDKELLEILEKNYKKVYIWIQGSNDEEYIKTLSNTVELIAPTLDAYDSLLDSKINLDYIGTRLHAGIRALQKKRRSIIIGVDNRAIEKKQDFNITVINRDKIELLEEQINKEFETIINLDFNAINQWKQQFLK